jgi:signal transduction histidine kinase
VSAAGDKRERKQPAHKMTREEAERLRELLRDTKPAELEDLSVLQRIGRAIVQAIHGPSKRNR